MLFGLCCDRIGAVMRLKDDAGEMRKKVLVTGITGQLGHDVMADLAEASLQA